MVCIKRKPQGLQYFWFKGIFIKLPSFPYSKTLAKFNVFLYAFSQAQKGCYIFMMFSFGSKYVYLYYMYLCSKVYFYDVISFFTYS